LRDEDAVTVTALSWFLGQLSLVPADGSIAAHAAVLGAKYKLYAPDATHLATAIKMGAHRFITNNSRDFPQSIKEIEVTYPADLPDPASMAPVSALPHRLIHDHEDLMALSRH
jgi:predicted nucleic acid-binding protein